MPASSAPPGLPTTSPPPTRSFWQVFNELPHKEGGSSSAQLLDVTDHVHSERLPESADVIIVGSGISGAVAAYELLSLASSSSIPPPSVVLVEARSACSGATGRNGGHCRPDAFAGYPHYVDMVGKEQARKVLINEAQTMQHIAGLVEQLGIDCDWDPRGTCAAYMMDEARDKGRRAYRMYRDDWGDEAVENVRWFEGEEAAKITRLPGCLSAALFPAASMWPLKFVHALLRHSIDRGLQLYTHTPVHGLHRQDDGGSWKVETSRGSIRARKVLLATNGYSLALLPGLESWILPHRSQCSSHRVPTSFTRSADDRGSALSMTYSIIRSAGDYDYLVQNLSTGQFVLGGGHPFAPNGEQMGLEKMDDSVLLDGITRHLEGALDEGFQGFREDREREAKQGRALGVTTMWSGIQGYTRDSLPIVGHIPSSLVSKDGEASPGISDDIEAEDSGLFACLGFQGHGMARASTCARGTAKLVLRSMQSQDPRQASPAADEEAWEALTGLPHCFRFTEQRRARRDVDARRDM